MLEYYSSTIKARALTHKQLLCGHGLTDVARMHGNNNNNKQPMVCSVFVYLLNLVISYIEALPLP